MPTPEHDPVVRFWMQVIYYLGQFSILLPLAVGLWRRHFFSPAVRATLYCFVMWTGAQFAGWLASAVLNRNVFVWHLVDVLDLWFIGLIYYHALRFPFRRHFRLIGILFTVLALFDSFVLNDLWQAILYRVSASNDITVSVKNLLIVGLVLAYFEQTLRQLRITALERNPMFIISTGLLIYYTGTFVMFLVRSGITDMYEYFKTNVILGVLSVLLNGMVAWAFWLEGPEVEEAAPLA